MGLDPDRPALVARGIRKSFSGVEVLHGVDLTVRRGQVHGLVGQNGAGKSTLVKIIDGAYKADEGQIEIAPPTATGGAPGRGRADIAMVFQEFSLIGSMTVGQNILLSREPKGRSGLIDDRELKQRASEALTRVGASIDPGRRVEELPVGSRQLVEVAKAISKEANILILDEPTASLTAAEIETLMAAIRRLTDEGIAIIYISHHLSEVMAICDHVTVLRDGAVALSAPTASTTIPAVIEAMLGRSLERALTYQPRTIDRTGGPLLRVLGLRTERLRDVSFDLHRGEILGIAGLLGSGRTELMRALFGIDHLKEGSIEVRGTPVRLRGPRDALDAGISLVPEDRARQGLVAGHSVERNALMSAWRLFSRGGLVRDRDARRSATQLVDRLAIQTTGIDQPVRDLSGGNQQKVVVARNLSVRPSVFLLDDPTVGVDVGSKREILTQTRSLADQGAGIVLVSSEFEELSGVADRVLVIRDGAILRELDRSAGDDLTEEGLSRAVQSATEGPGTPAASNGSEAQQEGAGSA
jgi:ribose transport system ATP-binding protein